jgi:hypothetical protein
MSTSDLYILNSKSVTHVRAFHNGYGTAPRCWSHLADKYIPEKPDYAMDDQHLTKVWALANDDRLSLEEKICLMMTFDGAYVPLENLGQAAAACSLFGVHCEDHRSVNHWPALGEVLQELSTQKFNRHAIGVALSPTSVCDPWADETEHALSEAWGIFNA